MKTISRDPFARASLVREMSNEHPNSGCSWCGSGRLNPKNGKPRKLFKYGVERDDRPGPGNVHWAKGSFCSVGCYRSYSS